MLDSGWLLMHLCHIEPGSQRERLVAKSSPFPQSPVPSTGPRRKRETEEEMGKGSYEESAGTPKVPRGQRGQGSPP